MRQSKRPGVDKTLADMDIPLVLLFPTATPEVTQCPIAYSRPFFCVSVALLRHSCTVSAALLRRRIAQIRHDLMFGVVQVESTEQFRRCIALKHQQRTCCRQYRAMVFQDLSGPPHLLSMLLPHIGIICRTLPSIIQYKPFWLCVCRTSINLQNQCF